VCLQPILASLTDTLSARLTHAVDVLVFNPPYVPTDEPELTHAQDRSGIEGSWAGGAYGMQVTERLFECLELLLSAQGRFYLVSIKQNDIPGICRRLLTRNLVAEVKIFIQ